MHVFIFVILIGHYKGDLRFVRAVLDLEPRRGDYRLQAGPHHGAQVDPRVLERRPSKRRAASQHAARRRVHVLRDPSSARASPSLAGIRDHPAARPNVLPSST